MVMKVKVTMIVTRIKIAAQTWDGIPDPEFWNSDDASTPMLLKVFVEYNHWY